MAKKPIPLKELPVYSKHHLPVKGEDLSSGGVFLCYKPKGWSSFRMVGLLRKMIQVKKTGHAGTLDPMAEGLLILCCGKGTKSISQIQELGKQYIAGVTFGASTPSYDAETEIDEEAAFEHISVEEIQKSLAKNFSGEINQKAPAYSALKHKGQPLYKLARKGLEVPVKERLVTIYNTELIKYEAPVLDVKIDCSKGTYIRSIAHDLGISLKSRAYMSRLIRTAIGDYKVEDALHPDEIISYFEEWHA